MYTSKTSGTRRTSGAGVTSSAETTLPPEPKRTSSTSRKKQTHAPAAGDAPLVPSSSANMASRAVLPRPSAKSSHAGSIDTNELFPALHERRGDLAADLRVLQEKRDPIVQKITALNQVIEENRPAERALENFYLQTTDLSDERAERTRLFEDLHGLDNPISKIQAQISELDWELKALLAHGTNTPPAVPEKLTESKAAIETELQALQSRQAALTGREQTVTAARRRLGRDRIMPMTLDRERASIESELKTLSGKIRQKQQELASVNKEIGEIEKKLALRLFVETSPLPPLSVLEKLALKRPDDSSSGDSCDASPAVSGPASTVFDDAEDDADPFQQGGSPNHLGVQSNPFVRTPFPIVRPKRDAQRMEEDLRNAHAI